MYSRTKQEKTMKMLAAQESFPVLPEREGSSNSGGSSVQSSSFHDEQSKNNDPLNKRYHSSSIVDNNEGAAGLDQTLARRENRAVRILRVVVLLALLGAALAVSILVYLYMKSDEQEALDRTFYETSRRLMDGFHANTRLRFQTMDLFATAVTIGAQTTGQEWPFVTLDDFEALGTAARVICKADFIGVYPYVDDATRKAWEEYTVENTWWINASFGYQQEFKLEHNRTVGARDPARALRNRNAGNYHSDHRGLQGEEEDGDEDNEDLPEVQNATFDGPDGITTQLYRYGTDEEGILFALENRPGPYFPTWQVSPTREYSAIDVNFNNNDPTYSPAFSDGLEECRVTKTALFGGVWNVDDEGYIDENDDYDFRTVPAGTIFYPVFDKVIGQDRKVVAVIDLDVEFGALFSAVLPSNANTLVCVVQNTCNQLFSYQVSGDTAIYLGPEDLHDPKFDNMMVQTLLTDFDLSEDGSIYNGARVNKEFCPWVLSIYGTQDLYDAYITEKPIYYMCAVLGIFLFTCLVFILYDFIVEYRQRKVMTTAVNSEQIVSNLFPKAFREQLYENNKNTREKKKKPAAPGSFERGRVEEFLAASSELESRSIFLLHDSPPMAELYPNCTVFFCDIAGFTAWSSVRSPTEVFTLLETIYGAFDKLAAKYKVFKIETIGDCYVAVTGLPRPQKNHALLMVKFSRDCLMKMKKVTKRLESALGEGTSSLSCRVGLNSGSVTAGVLRGEKARFQLFGDTVNTAARMESNGVKDFIHASQSTADCLTALGKGHWVHPREEKIQAKGKGMLQTYFIRPVGGAGSVISSFGPETSSTGEEDEMYEVELALAEMAGSEEDKTMWLEANFRRIGWVADLLREELKKIITERGTAGSADVWTEKIDSFSSKEAIWDEKSTKLLLTSSASGAHEKKPLTVEVNSQITEYVARIAFSFQRDLHYHSFEHGCFVLISLQNMIKHLRNLFDFDLDLSPWAKFACFLSALIRNLDPPKMPILEQGNTMHLRQRNVAEQRSVDAAYSLLLDNRFKELRQALCSTRKELHRFWTLVQNMHVATDHSSYGSSSSDSRGNRWDRAFTNPLGDVTPDIKIVPLMEHIALIAQETHAVQHWEKYTKWSELLFDEYNKGYHEGALSVDPGAFWRQTQLAYFDDLVIPVMKKVDQTGVLGGIGGSMYGFATENRRELESALETFVRPFETVEENMQNSFRFENEVEV